MERRAVDAAGWEVRKGDNVVPGTTELASAAGARAVHTAVLVDKEHERKARPDLKASFTGLYCADRYVFGYGMDYHEQGRNLPAIYALK